MDASLQVFNACNLAWEHVVEGEGNLVPQSFMTGM